MPVNHWPLNLKSISPERVIDFLLEEQRGDEVAKAIALDVSACIAEALAFMGSSNEQRYLIGGGANVSRFSYGTRCHSR